MKKLNHMMLFEEHSIHKSNILNKNGVEDYRTLCFKTERIALKNKSDIESYFGERLVKSEVLFGDDERGDKGYYVKYELKK